MEDSYRQQTETTNGRQLNKDSYRQLMGDN